MLRKRLEEEFQKMMSILENIKEHDKRTIEGTLRLGKSQGSVQYFYHTSENKDNGTYIPKSNIALAQQLAQQSYNGKVYKLAEKRIKQLDKILRDYEDDEIDKLYINLHPERQKLVTPVQPTYQQQLEKWISIPYEGRPFYDNDDEISHTNKGMRVRSKSEALLANYFDSIGLLYKYECPLELPPYGKIYPDFTFLSPSTGQEIYWEHEGRMDDPNYVKTAVKKINLYQENGIYPGERLILTYETANTVLNAKIMKALTARYLLW